MYKRMIVGTGVSDASDAEDLVDSKLDFNACFWQPDMHEQGD